MNWFEIIERIRLSRKPIITTADIARFAGGNRKYASLVARRLEVKGKIIRIEKGKYMVAEANIFSVASHLLRNSYLSFFSALAVNGIGEQIPSLVTVACTKTKKQIAIGDYRIDFLSLGEKCLWGYGVKHLDGWHCFVAEPEKAIIDIIYFSERYSISEVFEIIKGKGIDVKNCCYMRRNFVFCCNKRLGYILDKNGIDCYKELSGFIKGSHIPLDPRFKGVGKKNDKWRIIENILVG